MNTPLVSATELVDESGRAFFDREVTLERAFLQMRVAAAAQSALEDFSGDPGAPVVFPVTLFGPFEKGSGCGPAGQRALLMSHEPGSIFPKGTTRVSWSTVIEGYVFEGHFTVAVGERLRPNSEHCVVRHRNMTQEISSPFPSVGVKVLRGAAQRRALRELVAPVQDAQAAILRLSEGLLVRALQRFSSRLASSNLDWDDLMQIASMKTLDMAVRYASADRPHAAWGRVVGLGVDKAVQRALNKDAGIGRPEEAVRKLFRDVPEMRDASVDDIRSALIPQIAEAATWSDARIAQAVGGAPRIAPLPVDDILGNGQVRIETAGSMVDLLSDLIPNVADRRRVAPFLIVEGLIDGDPSVYSSSQVSRAKRDLMEILASRVESGEASQYQSLLDAFLSAKSETSTSGSKARGG